MPEIANSSDVEIVSLHPLQRRLSTLRFLYVRTLKRHLRIKAFYGTSENAVKGQVKKQSLLIDLWSNRSEFRYSYDFMECRWATTAETTGHL
jgi:hypothetical protein